MNHPSEDDVPAQPTGRIGPDAADQPPTDRDPAAPDPTTRRAGTGRGRAGSTADRDPVAGQHLARLLGLHTVDVGKLTGLDPIARSVLGYTTPQVAAMAAATWPLIGRRQATMALLANPAIGPANTALAMPAVRNAASVVFIPTAMDRFVTLAHLARPASFPLPGMVPPFLPPATYSSDLAMAIGPALPRLTGALPAFDLFRQHNQHHLLSSIAAFVPLPDAIGALLRGWRNTAGQDGPTRHPATQAYAAALRVRTIILTDPDSDPAVIEFGRVWLNFPSMPRSRIDATVAALLDDAWLDDPDSVDLPRRLRNTVNRVRQVHRPITEREFCGHLVQALEAPVTHRPGVQPLTLLDLTPAPPSMELVGLDRAGGWDDPRIARVLARLDPDEHEVVLAYAHGDPDTTWTMAAAQVGRDAKFATGSRPNSNGRAAR